MADQRRGLVLNLDIKGYKEMKTQWFLFSSDFTLIKTNLLMLYSILPSLFH